MGRRISLDLTAHSETRFAIVFPSFLLHNVFSSGFSSRMQESIAACHRSQQWQRALAMVSMLDHNSMDLDVTLCNLSISICETGRRWRDATYLLMSTERVSICPDVITITAAMSASESCSCWEMAVHLFEQVQGRRIEPNGMTYRVLVSACVAGGRTRWALQSLRTMAKKHVEGDVIALNAAIAQLGQRTHWKAALNFSTKLACDALRSDAVTYTSLTTTVAKINRWKAALGQVRFLKDREMEPDCQTMASNAVLSACSEPSGHLWQVAVAIFQDLNRQRLCSVVTYSNLMSVCEHIGRWEIALELAINAERALPADLESKQSTGSMVAPLVSPKLLLILQAHVLLLLLLLLRLVPQ